jgi:hypothetical protein
MDFELIYFHVVINIMWQSHEIDVNVLNIIRVHKKKVELFISAFDVHI